MFTALDLRFGTGGCVFALRGTAVDFRKARPSDRTDSFVYPYLHFTTFIASPHSFCAVLPFIFFEDNTLLKLHNGDLSLFRSSLHIWLP